MNTHIRLALATLVVLLICVVGCSGPQATVAPTTSGAPATGTPVATATRTETPAVAASPTQAATPTHADVSTPGVTGSPAPTLGSASPGPTDSGATLSDVSLTSASPPAYLIVPSATNSKPNAGIIWFHWLETGDPTSNRTEF